MQRHVRICTIGILCLIGIWSFSFLQEKRQYFGWEDDLAWMINVVVRELGRISQYEIVRIRKMEIQGNETSITEPLQGVVTLEFV